MHGLQTTKACRYRHLNHPLPLDRTDFDGTARVTLASYGLLFGRDLRRKVGCPRNVSYLFYQRVNSIAGLRWSGVVIRSLNIAGQHA